MTQSILTRLLNIQHSSKVSSCRISLGLKAAPITALLLASIFLTASAQTMDTGPMLGIELTSSQPAHYTDDEGYTVVIGEIKNLKEFPVTDVRVLASFYTTDSLELPSDTQIGDTLLDVIPAFGSSPYMIRSNSQGMDIYGVSVNLLGFTSSAAKNASLELGAISAKATNTLDISGTLTNNAQGNITDAMVHVLVYDALDPPRVVAIDSQQTGVLPAGETTDYTFSLQDYEYASSVKIIADSSSYTADPVEIPIIRSLTQPLVIENIAIVDAEGRHVSSLTAGVPVYIQSRITGQDVLDIEYAYIVQVKRSEALSLVEFIGSTKGLMTSSGVALSLIEWTPSTSGLFFVETYVWSLENTPLSTPGPISLLHVR